MLNTSTRGREQGLQGELLLDQIDTICPHQTKQEKWIRSWLQRSCGRRWEASAYFRLASKEVEKGLSSKPQDAGRN